jgi:hypothetical protein
VYIFRSDNKKYVKVLISNVGFAISQLSYGSQPAKLDAQFFFLHEYNIIIILKLNIFIYFFIVKV